MSISFDLLCHHHSFYQFHLFYRFVCVCLCVKEPCWLLYSSSTLSLLYQFHFVVFEMWSQRIGLLCIQKPNSYIVMFQLLFPSKSIINWRWILSQTSIIITISVIYNIQRWIKPLLQQQNYQEYHDIILITNIINTIIHSIKIIDHFTQPTTTPNQKFVSIIHWMIIL